MRVASGTSDNAARATTRAVGARKVKEIGVVEALQQISREALEQAPLELEHAARAWAAMSDAQREVAKKGLHELGCGGHSLNLTIDDSHKRTENPTLEACVVRDLAGNVIRRFMMSHKVKPVIIKKLQGTFTAGKGWSKIAWCKPGDVPGVKKIARSEAVYIWKHDGKKTGHFAFFPAGSTLTVRTFRTSLQGSLLFQNRFAPTANTRSTI